MEQSTVPESWPTATPTQRGTWFRDPWFSVGFLLWSGAVTLALTPILPAEVRSDFADLWSELVTLPFTVGIAAWNVWKAESSKEKKFWWLFVGALSAWMAVRILYVAGPEEWGIGHDVLTDILYGVFYLMLALALEMQPHTGPAHGAWVHPRKQGVPIFTTIIFFAATVLYFVILPARERPEAYSLWGFSFGLYVVLDLYLCGRLLSLSHPGRDGWSNVYRWLIITFVLWALTDAAEGALYAEIIPWIEPGSLWELAWFVPSLTLLIALRSRWWPKLRPAGS